MQQLLNKKHETSPHFHCSSLLHKRNQLILIKSINKVFHNPYVLRQRCQFFHHWPIRLFLLSFPYIGSTSPVQERREGENLRVRVCTQLMLVHKSLSVRACVMGRCKIRFKEWKILLMPSRNSEIIPYLKVY